MLDPFVGDRIRKLREERRLSRLDLQRKTGLSEATISRAERAGVVTARTSELLAEVLGVAPEELRP